MVKFSPRPLPQIERRSWRSSDRARRGSDPSSCPRLRGASGASSCQGLGISGASAQAKPPRSMNFVPTPSNARLPRLIEVQAACLVARLDAEGVETALGQQFFLVGVEACFLSALGRVEIEVDRQLALADQGKAAAAAGAVVGLPGRIDAKHAHGRDQEAGRGRQPDGQGAAAGVAGRIAERQAEQIASTAGHRRPGRAAAELQSRPVSAATRAPASPPRRKRRLALRRPAARAGGWRREARARRRKQKGRRGRKGEEGEERDSSPRSLSPLAPFLSFLASPANNRRGAIRPMRPDGKPYRHQGHQEAAGETDRRALPGNVQREKGRADGRQPPGSQSEEA